MIDKKSRSIIFFSLTTRPISAESLGLVNSTFKSYFSSESLDQFQLYFFTGKSNSFTWWIVIKWWIVRNKLWIFSGGIDSFYTGEQGGPWTSCLLLGCESCGSVGKRGGAIEGKSCRVLGIKLRYLTNISNIYTEFDFSTLWVSETKKKFWNDVQYETKWLKSLHKTVLSNLSL